MSGVGRRTKSGGVHPILAAMYREEWRRIERDRKLSMKIVLDMSHKHPTRMPTASHKDSNKES